MKFSLNQKISIQSNSENSDCLDYFKDNITNPTLIEFTKLYLRRISPIRGDSYERIWILSKAQETIIFTLEIGSSSENLPFALYYWEGNKDKYIYGASTKEDILDYLNHLY